MFRTGQRPLQIRHSIRKKITILFSVVLMAALTACWLANSFFLERYYLSNKKDVLQDAYGRLDAASGSESLETESFIQLLSVICETNNISLLVMDSSGYVKIYTTKDYMMMRRRLYDYLFGQVPPENMEKMKVLEEQDYYSIRMCQDFDSKIEYVEMIGSLQSGELFLMRTALEPIRESVQLANRFLLYVGLSVLAIGALIIQMLAKRIAEPLLELAKLSERMSNLEFDVKF